MEYKVIKAIIGTTALSGAAIAGPIDTPLTTPPTSNSGDFCNTLENFGTLYKNKENPYIQEITLSGRFHGQYAHVEGSDVNGNNFNEDYREIRRLRAGIEIKAFHDFTIKGAANLENDTSPAGGDRELGYHDFDQVQLTYKKKDILGFDSLALSYGRHKLDLGQEASISSRKIKTVERSAISNKLSGGRYTGILASAERNGVSGTVGLVSLDQSDFIGNWDAGRAIYANTSFEALGGEVLIDAFYNLDQGTIDDQVDVGYEWAASVAWNGTLGSWDLMMNVAFGDNGNDTNPDREGSFYAFVVMPSKEIIEDKLEFVTRYQFQASTEDEGIRMDSRYARFAETGATDIGRGRGDSHQSIYAGLNYFFCGHNSKVMAGLEHETLSAQNGNVDTTTLWLAYRMYF